jgi:glutamate-5-semialdehyde dehydrogenase
MSAIEQTSQTDLHRPDGRARPQGPYRLPARSSRYAPPSSSALRCLPLPMLWINAHRKQILAANAKDMEAARQKGISGAFLDRLLLTDARIDGIIEAVKTIAELPDPVGAVIAEWDPAQRPRHIARAHPAGRDRRHLRIPPQCHRRCRRPDCIKSGNAVILRGGSGQLSFEPRHPSTCLARRSPSRRPARRMRAARAHHGSRSRGRNARVSAAISTSSCPAAASRWSRASSPKRACPSSPISKASCMSISTPAPISTEAISVTLNAKMRRTGICGATETLLVHESLLASISKPIIEALIARGCEIRGDETASAHDPDGQCRHRAGLENRI